MSFSSIVTFSSLFCITFVSAQNTFSYTPAASVPTGASQPLSPSFAGLGIETSNLFSYTGTEDANTFSINLLQNLANYTGTPPHLRIGGNTEDYMLYDASYTEYNLGVNPDPTGTPPSQPDASLLGPAFFKALDRFPTGTPITFGLNLADDGNDWEDRIIAMANASVHMLKNVNLTSFEIGNEPDLYVQNGFRTGPWDGTTYTSQWEERASAVYDQVLKPAGYAEDFFEPGCTASTIGTSFQISLLAQDGIVNPPNGTKETFVSTWNQHDYYYYIGVSTYTLTMQLFTDLSTTPTQFASWVQQVGQATTLGYPYALREMGVVGPIGMAGITDVFAASLWTLNFFLYSATVNISSVQMHMTDNSNASAWAPIPKYGEQPFVRPNYYAFAAMAQIIGCGGGTQISGPGFIGSTAPAGYENRLAVYSAYKSSKLQSVILINTFISNTTTEPKNTVTFDLSLPELANQDLYLSYLTAAGADAYHNTTFNGISYEQNALGIPSIVNSSIPIIKAGSDGTASIPLRDSEAVVVNIGKVLGADSEKGGCPSNYKKPVSTVVGTKTATATKTVAHATGASATITGASSATASSGASLALGRESSISWSSIFMLSLGMFLI